MGTWSAVHLFLEAHLICLARHEETDNETEQSYDGAEDFDNENPDESYWRVDMLA
jgi:hypothetical protein